MVSKRLREGQDRGEQTEGLDSRWPVFAAGAHRDGSAWSAASPATAACAHACASIAAGGQPAERPDMKS